MEAQTPEELIALTQEIMGYCLCNSVKAHKAFIFLGAGSNGKSVLCEIMTALAGGVENVSTVTLKDLSQKFSLSQIMNKTLNIATENEVIGNLNTQMLKAVSSGEAIQIEEKFQQPFSYRPYAKLVFAMNNLPYVSDRTYALERRFVIIPFEKRFVGREPREGANEAKIERNIADTLINEELAGIFTFAMQGLERLKKNNFVFTRSYASEKKLEEYREQLDATLEFVRTFVEPDEDAKPVNVTDFWNYYKRWCGKEGYTKSQTTSQKSFSQATQRVFAGENIPFNKDKHNGGLLHLFGIRVRGLNDTPDEQDDDLDDFLDGDDGSQR